ncbi:ABC transporter ATP-binding protein, partial [Streptomyces pseudogriseolus]
AEIGALAAAGGVELHELSPRQASLEQAFMDLTRDAVEYQAETKTETMTGASR